MLLFMKKKGRDCYTKNKQKPAIMYGKTAIAITGEHQGQRLDVFLSEKLHNISRSQVQKMIKNEQVLVNGKKASVHRFLKTGDKIKINAEQKKNEITKDIKNSRLDDAASNTKSLFKKIKIKKETPNFLIIEKPAGLLVHPTDQGEKNTLVDWLIEKYPEMRKIGEDPARAGIVHRLDKEVSGLMIIPRNQNSFDYFKKQFKEHAIIKKYLALVHGEIERDAQEIDFPISRSSTKTGLFAAHPTNRGEKLSAKDKKAITNFKVIDRYKNYTLLEIEIFTGRTHQIRVHMLSYGHPVVGDKLYKTRKQKNNAMVDRIFLHAAELSFTGADGKNYHFQSPLPKSLSITLSKLKN